MTKERKILSINQKSNTKSERDSEDKKHSSGGFSIFCLFLSIIQIPDMLITYLIHRHFLPELWYKFDMISSQIVLVLGIIFFVIGLFVSEK